MWRTLAKRVRDWLDRFLAELADDPASGITAASRVARLGNKDSLVGASEQTDFGEYSNAGEQADVYAWNALQPSGPPEDWLRRVQEGAPELLHAAEERGTRSSDASSDATSHNEGLRATTSPRESLSRFSPAPARLRFLPSPQAS